MAVTIQSIITLARLRLIEQTANFWSDDELTQICIAGIRDLWRDIVDLKQEHYLTVNDTDVFLAPNATQLSGVPTDVHKMYMIEPSNLTANGPNAGLQFRPKEYNSQDFMLSRSLDAIDPQNATIWYAVAGQGAPVNAPTVFVAPPVTSQVNLRFMYCPTLPQLTINSAVPIPGEADNALVAWTVAFARAKEDDQRAPDANWLAIYATDKQHLLESLGLRDYQEPLYVQAEFEEYWG